MSEHLRHPPTDSTHERMADQPPSGYWIGFNYKGPYWNRLTVNRTHCESVLRSMGAPPCVITGEDWQPPQADVDVDVVDKGIAGFKKVGLRQRQRAEQPPRQFQYFALNPLDQTTAFEGKILPIGWRISINGAAIVHYIDLQHPNATSEQQEKLFVERFNRTIQEALAAVAVQEFLDSRGEYDSLLHKIALECSGSAVPIIFGLGLKTSPTIISIGRTASVGAAANLIAHSPETKKPFLHNGMGASNAWRRAFFPDRYELEQHGPPAIFQILIRCFPACYVSEVLAHYLYMRCIHLLKDDSFVSLCSATCRST